MKNLTREQSRKTKHANDPEQKFMLSQVATLARLLIVPTGGPKTFRKQDKQTIGDFSFPFFVFGSIRIRFLSFLNDVFTICTGNMFSVTDMLNLNKLGMFQTLRKVLETNGANAIRNLLAYKDQILYVWNPDECCLYSLLLSTVHEEHPYYQVRI